MKEKLSATPVAASGLSSGVIGVSAGSRHTCAVTATGAALCWGVGGLLGDGTKVERDEPVPVSGLSSGVAAISAGFNNACALTTNGSVLCWGADASGKLAKTPVPVSGLDSKITSAFAGYDQSCVINASGAVLSWGGNGEGELGDGSEAKSHVPVVVSGLASGATVVAPAAGFTCALTSPGRVLCWGVDEHGQLGVPPVQHHCIGGYPCSLVPVEVAGF